MGKPVIKVLTGQRRVGKSYLLKGIRRELEQIKPGVPILEFSTENEDLAGIRDPREFLLWVDSRVPARTELILLADEVQELDGFEQALQMLLARGNCDIYCTGSNARYLSSDIVGRLSGRVLELRVHPLGYNEFREFHKLDNTDENLLKYLRFGGMPFLHNLPLEDEVVFEYLGNIYNTILYKDVIGRKGVRNTRLLERLVRYLADNTGSIVSAKKISDFLKSQKSGVSTVSILEYLAFLEEACFINRVQRSDLTGKRIFEIGEKYYFTDLGLRHTIKKYGQEDLGKVLENAIYQHLSIHGWSVKTGQDNGREIDFVAEKGNEKIYVQVTLSLTAESTQKREFGNLMSLPDAWPRYVVSLDPMAAGQDGVRHIYARDFLGKPGDW